MTTSDAPLTVWLMPSAYGPHRGGIEAVTAQLARELLARGHRVVVITNQHPRELPTDEIVDGVRVLRIAYGARRRTPGGAARFVRDRRAARDRLARLTPAPDVIHVHGVSSQADAALHAARHHGAALVVTTHGEITADAHRLYEKGHARQTLREILSNAAAVTVPSRWVVQESERVGLPLPSGCVVVPNGLDLEAWRQVPAAPATSQVALAWGRDSPEKGFPRLPPAWRVVRESLPESELKIIGQGPGEVRTTYEEIGITQLPPASPDEVRRHLADARVVVVPSVFEAVGLVALEALAAGRAVVYSTGTGMDETIGRYGIAVDAADPEALAAAIVAAFTQPSPAPPPHELFRDWSDMAADYLALYRRVLDR